MLEPCSQSCPGSPEYTSHTDFLARNPNFHALSLQTHPSIPHLWRKRRPPRGEALVTQMPGSALKPHQCGPAEGVGKVETRQNCTSDDVTGFLTEIGRLYGYSPNGFSVIIHTFCRSIPDACFRTTPRPSGRRRPRRPASRGCGLRVQPPSSVLSVGGNHLQVC